MSVRRNPLNQRSAGGQLLQPSEVQASALDREEGHRSHELVLLMLQCAQLRAFFHERLPFRICHHGRAPFLAIGGVLANLGTGYIVSNFSYAPVFLMAGLMHPLSVVIIYKLLPDRYFDKANA